MSLAVPRLPPKGKLDEYIFEFADQDPKTSPTNVEGTSVEFSQALLKTFEIVKISRSTSRIPIIDGE
jgi:hypothetical protein